MTWWPAAASVGASPMWEGGGGLAAPGDQQERVSLTGDLVGQGDAVELDFRHVVPLSLPTTQLAIVAKCS